MKPAPTAIINSKIVRMVFLRELLLDDIWDVAAVVAGFGFNFAIAL